MSPRPELSKPMTSVTAAASTSRKLTRTTTSPSHRLNAERRHLKRNGAAADQSAPSTLTALLAAELPPFRLTLIVEAGSLGYRRGGLFPPPQHARGVLPRAQGRIVIERPPQVGEEGVVVDVVLGELLVARDWSRHGEVVLTLVGLAVVARLGAHLSDIDHDSRGRVRRLPFRGCLPEIHRDVIDTRYSRDLRGPERVGRLDGLPRRVHAHAVG